MYDILNRIFAEKKKTPSREMSEILGVDATQFQLSESKCRGVFLCLNENCMFRQSYQVAHQAVGIIIKY